MPIPFEFLFSFPFHNQIHLCQLNLFLTKGTTELTITGSSSQSTIMPFSSKSLCNSPTRTHIYLDLSKIFSVEILIPLAIFPFAHYEMMPFIYKVSTTSESCFNMLLLKQIPDTFSLEALLTTFS
jgi:hypothetical protein